MTPQVLLLDFDGLVRHWRDSGAREGERLAGLPAGALDIAYRLPEYQLAQLGVLTDGQWAAAVRARVIARHGPAAQAAIGPWRADRGQIDHQMLSLVQAARRHVPVAILSNTTSAFHADLCLHGLSGAFDAVYTSAALGVAKPAPAAYLAVAAALGTSPGQVFFADDEMIHVRGARHTGMQAEHFTSPARLAAALARAGLPLAGLGSAAA